MMSAIFFSMAKAGAVSARSLTLLRTAQWDLAQRDRLLSPFGGHRAQLLLLAIGFLILRLSGAARYMGSVRHGVRVGGGWDGSTCTPMLYDWKALTARLNWPTSKSSLAKYLTVSNCECACDVRRCDVRRCDVRSCDVRRCDGARARALAKMQG